MSKDSAVQRINPDLSLPAHLKDKEIVGIDELKEIIVPPRLKVVQKQSRDELLNKFSKGSVIIVPQEALIAEPETPFFFVPLFFYREFCTWAPIEERGNMPMILERSLNKTSPLAQKAQQPETRKEKIDYEGKKVEVRHIEHLNFVVCLHNHDYEGEPMILSFSRGEYRVGSSFAALLKMRKASPYYCVFQAKTAHRPGQLGEWEGIDISNPDMEGVSPWVAVDKVSFYEEAYEELKGSFDKGQMEAAYEDETTDDDDKDVEL